MCKQPEIGNASEVAATEALDVQTKPFKAGSNMSNSTALTIGTTSVRQVGDLYSLNDLHKASGSEEKHKPALFMRNDQAKALVAEIAKGTEMHLLMKAEKGRYGGTYACKELVIAYAAWISAAFHLKVIRVFLNAVMPVAVTRNPAIDYDRISPGQAQDLKQIVEAIVKAGVQGFGETWARLHRKFKVNSYLELPATRHLEARNYLIGKLPTPSAETIVDDQPAKASEPTSHLRATVKHAGRYENGDWGLSVVSGNVGFDMRVTQEAMRPDGVKAGDEIRIEYLKKDSVFMGPFTRIILWSEYRAPEPEGWSLPAVQVKEITDRLERLGKLFHPFSEQAADVIGIGRTLRGLHPKLGLAEPGYRRLLPRAGQSGCAAA